MGRKPARAGLFHQGSEAFPIVGDARDDRRNERTGSNAGLTQPA